MQCLPGDQDATCRSAEGDEQQDTYRRRSGGGTIEKQHTATIIDADEELYAFYRYVPYGRSQRIGGKKTRRTMRQFKRMEDYMRNIVSKPEYDEVREMCTVKHEDCTIWASGDECVDNARFMQAECSAACMNCHMLLHLYEDLLGLVTDDTQEVNQERVILKTWIKVENSVVFHLLTEDEFALRKRKKRRKERDE